MNTDWRPSLQNDLVTIQPLQAGDFEALYQVASDPLIWEQHPDSNRYQRLIFEAFFKGAMASGSAFMILDTRTGAPIGSSRYYEWDETAKSIAVGYTFLAKDYWGGAYNSALKALMLSHAFTLVDTVVFHVGSGNIRSQKAVEKLGAVKVGEATRAHGSGGGVHFIYDLRKETWLEKR